MEGKINIQELLESMRKNLIIIVSFILIGLVSSAVITFFLITPQYQASTQILVNQSQNENANLSSTDLESSRELISTYNVIITSPTVLEPVMEETNFQGSLEELRSKIEVSAEENSQITTITIEDSEPRIARTLTNTLAQTFEQQIPNIMSVDNVSVLSDAQLLNNGEPVSPQPILNLFIGTALGLVIGVGVALLIEYFDKSIKDEQDIEKELELPILGVIPTMRETEFNKSPNQTNLNKSMRSKNREERKTS